MTKFGTGVHPSGATVLEHSYIIPKQIAVPQVYTASSIVLLSRLVRLGVRCDH